MSGVEENVETWHLLFKKYCQKQTYFKLTQDGFFKFISGILYPTCTGLTPSPPSATTGRYSNSLNQDETPSTSASHPDPNCLTPRQHFHQGLATLQHFENLSRQEVSQRNFFLEKSSRLRVKIFFYKLPSIQWVQYWSLLNWHNLWLRCGCVAVPLNWFFDIISSYFAKFKNVVHSLEPGEMPSNSQTMCNVLKYRKVL